MAQPDIRIQRPLSRSGSGPPLIILIDSEVDASASEKTLDPAPLQKWAEESFTVAQLTVYIDQYKHAQAASGIFARLMDIIGQLRTLPATHWAGKVVVISYLSSPCRPLDEAIKAIPAVRGLVSYGAAHDLFSVPYLVHTAELELPHETTPGAGNVSGALANRYSYSGAGPLFVLPASQTFQANSASVAHTRTLGFLKPILGGPYFNLENIWEEHTAHEFGDRSVEETMNTMVAEPYVNHVPTMTGGIGRDRLTNFYRDHFIFSNPADTELELVSRTVGIDRVVDEFLFKCTHDREIDWLVPGLPPTGKHISVPFTSIVNIRGDRLYHEHISWDQSTVLRQLGLLPEYLPFPYALPDGRTPGPGKRFEYRLPVSGLDTAKKLLDENAVESNGMFSYAIREVDDPQPL